MRVHHPISLILLTLVFASCSSVSQKKEAPKKLGYSSETQKSFEEIEKEMLMERYKRMRVEDGILQQRPGQNYNPQPRGLPPKTFEAPLTRPSPPQKTAQPKRIKPQQRQSPKVRRVEVDPKEQQREIQQNLTYFCMKMRKDSRFSSGEACEKYTQTVEQECLGKFSKGERALTRCVKSQL